MLLLWYWYAFAMFVNDVVVFVLMMVFCVVLCCLLCCLLKYWCAIAVFFVLFGMIV